MRVLMTGGGTAGHVNPAIAIANTIKKHHPDAIIEFVASNQSKDKANDLVGRAGYKLHRVNICGSYAIYDPRNLKTLYYMMKSAKESKRLILEFRPDVIIGTGGYACYPVLNEGAKLGIPTLVHESNAIPGRAVRKLAGRVDVVMTNFKSSAHALVGAKKIICVGNPTLFEINTATVAPRNDGFVRHVVSFGGSGGAENLNAQMCKVISKLAPIFPDTEFYHAAGKRDFENTRANFEQNGLMNMKNVKLVEYIYDMNERMATADLLICRAGAMTVSELALMGKAAIFVPSPYVAANHQYKNAKAIYDADACELVEEREFDSGRLEDVVAELLKNDGRRLTMSDNIKSFAVSDANEKIYKEIMTLIG